MAAKNNVGKTLVALALSTVFASSLAMAKPACEDPAAEMIPGAETAEEKVARLERELQGDLDRFEDCIQEDSRFDSGSSGGGEGGGSGGGPGGTGMAAAGAYGAESVVEQAQQDAEAMSATQASASEVNASEVDESAEGSPTTRAENSRQGLPGGSQENVPEDIPPGEDDDVVAAQLREAAMAAHNEEMAKDLWNEYRKYKGLPVEK